MEIQGEIILALPEQSGTSRSGNAWKKREYVLQTQENFPRKIHFDFFGDRADQYPLNVGDVITLFFDIESREYQGRWYTSIRGWKAEPAHTAAANVQTPPPAQGNTAGAMPGAFPPPPAQPAANLGGAPGDLPF